MHKSLPFDELCALYAVSDVCLVTSTRDGMNLVSDVILLRLWLLAPTRSTVETRCRTSTSRANKPAKA
jgi:hypothetical protein